MLLDSTGEGIYAIDATGRCTFANRTCLKLLGYDGIDELLGRNMHDLTHRSPVESSPPPVENRVVNRALRQREPTHAPEECFCRKQGASFPAEVWSYPIIEEGDVTGAVVVFEDTTQRRALQETQYRLAAIVDQSLDAIIGRSQSGLITTWNRGAELMYGYTAEEAVGQPISILTDPAQVSAEPEPLGNSPGLAPAQYEITRRRRDGTPIEVAVTASPIRDLTGTVIGLSTIERDISESRRTEQALREAKELAEAGNEAKSEFVANISHELRTPMNAILGMLDLSLRHPLAPDIEDYLETARESAQLLLALVNDLLDFSRMEAGHVELDSQAFSLRRVVGETLRAISLRASEQGLELVYRIDPAVPDLLRGDPRRLRQIILNLVGNGIKFTEAGEVVVWVDVDRREDEQVWLRITVSDTGIGIAHTDLDRIFEPFTQVDASTTRRYSGAGLGLTICRELVTQMGGEISIDSQVGKGTTAVCTARFLIERHAAPTHDTLLPKLRGRRALIVDDNATNRRILDETLSGWGIQTICAAGAEEALAALRSGDPASDVCDVALIDGLMPGIDGLSLVRSMRDENLSPRAILLLSSADRRQMQSLSEDLEIAHCLQKPIAQEDLLEVLAEAIGIKDADQRVEEQSDELEPEPAPVRPLRILVAEDTRANQKVIKSILESRGHSVDVTSNGKDAVACASGSDYDVVIMDVQMPVMDGLEATRLIRRLPEAARSRTPIIALTAHAMKEDRLKCLDAGMDAYLAKPIDADELIRLVERSMAAMNGDGSAVMSPDLMKIDMINSGQMQAVLDVAGALQRMGGDRELLKEVAQMFVEDVPPMLTQLSERLVEGDAEEATRLAHSIKGLAANLGADACTQAAGRLEETGRTGNLTECQSQLEVLRLSVNATNAAIEEQLLS